MKILIEILFWIWVVSPILAVVFFFLWRNEVRIRKDEKYDRVIERLNPKQRSEDC